MEAEDRERNRGYLHFGSESHYDPERTQAAMSSILMRRNHCSTDLVKPDDSFCRCYRRIPCFANCTCGEPGKIIEWVWDENSKSSRALLINDNRDVKFHLHFSIGTAVIRGSLPITNDQHYWEVKMTSMVYGTDMMVGIGTDDADIHKFGDSFCSVLGIDNKTWGLSYKGSFHHEGQSRTYTSGFGQGSIIGVHLDMWNGTLSYYKNRQPLGIACTGLKGKTLYPMVSSTAARSGMRIIHSVSFPSSLLYLCCVALRKAVPQHKSVLEVVPMPRPLQTFLANNLGWLLGEDRNANTAPSNGNSSRDPSPTETSNSEEQSYSRCTNCAHLIEGFNGHSGASFIRPREPSATLDTSPSNFVYLGRGVLLQNYASNDSRRVESADPEEVTGSSSKKMKVTRGFFGFFRDPNDDDDPMSN